MMDFWIGMIWSPAATQPAWIASPICTLSALTPWDFASNRSPKRFWIALSTPAITSSKLPMTFPLETRSPSAIRSDAWSPMLLKRRTLMPLPLVASIMKSSR